MISKVRTRATVGAGNAGIFGDLAAYISHESKALATRCSAQILSVQTAAREMELAAARAEHILNPLYHHVLSWPMGDRVEHEQIFKAAEGSLRALGFDLYAYQWVAAIHGDSDYQHVHILTNRVSPLGLKVINPRLDYKLLDRFCREQELLHGWTYDQGLYVINDAREVVENRNRYDQAPISGAARDSEVWTGQSSFQRWVGTTPAEELRAELCVRPVWGSVHETLLRFNLEYRPGSGGAIVVDRDNGAHVAKASHLGPGLNLPALERELGPYRAAGNLPLNMRETSYQRQIEAQALGMPWLNDPRVEHLHRRYQAEIAEWAASGRLKATEARRAVREATRKRIEDHRVYRREALNTVKALALPRSAKGAMRAAIVKALDEQLLALRKQNVEERAAIRSMHRASPSLFREWLKTQADAGDSNAREALLFLRRGQSQIIPQSKLQPIERVNDENVAPILHLETDKTLENSIEPAGVIREDRLPTNIGGDGLLDLETLSEPVNRIEDGASNSASNHEREDPAKRAASQEYVRQYGAYIKGVPTLETLWTAQLNREKKRDVAIQKRLSDRLRAIKGDDVMDRAQKEDARTRALLNALRSSDRHNQTIESERASLRELVARHRVPTYREFLEAAVAHDPKAQALLDELALDDRKGPEFDFAVIEQRPPVVRELRDLQHSRDSAGVVTYRMPSGRFFKDYGTHLESGTAEPQTVRTQLLLIAERFNNEIKITGTAEFQNVVLREAARLGIKVTNEKLQVRYAEEVALAQAEWAKEQALHQEHLSAAKERSVQIHDHADAHQDVFAASLRDSALAMARAKDPLVEIAPPDLEQVNGVVRDAWVLHNRAFVVMEVDRKSLLVETESKQLPEVFLAIDHSAVLSRGDDGRYHVLEAQGKTRKVEQQAERTSKHEHDDTLDLGNDHGIDHFEKPPREQGRNGNKKHCGTILEHGAAKYQWDENEKQSYYITYENLNGTPKTVWGVELPSALKESGAKVGDEIEMENLGKQPVTVKVAIRDADNKVTGHEERVVHKNLWKIDVTESRVPKVRAHTPTIPVS